MAKRAIITGITGQDGSYLAELLLERGYEVTGIVRRLSASNFWRIEHLLDRITLRPADLLDQLSLVRVIQDVKPDEFYNLAAMSFVPASWDQPLLTGDFNSQGVTRVLEAIRHVNPGSASTRPRRARCTARARSATDGADAVLPAQPVRRLEGVRPLHHGELPRELRHLRGVRHPLQPRVSPAWHRVRHTKGDGRRRADQARAGTITSGSATSTRAATGVSPATTSAPCG
jgi:NAD(P)-dependent dehydrogenase (short-subunit alcohol dehydrogenase family)